MTSVMDICNRALSEVGARATIASFDEASQEAVQCRLHYDNVRQGLLRAAHWSFARRQVALSQLGSIADGTSDYPWAYKYTYPSDCQRARYVLTPPPESGANSLYFSPNRNNRFVIGNDLSVGKVIFSNVQNAILVYTADITNPDHWDSGFDDALVAALCSKIVIPLTGNVQMKETFYNLANDAVNQARASDGNESLSSVDHTPDWIAVRAGYDVFGLATEANLGLWWQGWESGAWGS